MSQRTKENDRKYLKKHMLKMPWYVQKYIRYSERRLSPSTLRGYLIDYTFFFQWLIDDRYVDVDKIADIPLSTLEKLKVQDIEENFLYYLQNSQQRNQKTTLNRKISSLKSLFYYLVNIAEDDDLNPLLKRNVMAKIQLSNVKNSQETMAKDIANKILIDKEIDEFRSFVAEGYGKLENLHKLALKKYQQNKERDLAIISLILSSGLRIEEVANISIDDIDLIKNEVRVTRKGDKIQYVSFSSIAAADLKEYLEIRESRYNPLKTEKAFFLAKQQTKHGVPFQKRSMQLMIKKYTTAFGTPLVTAHKLRHSFATRFHEINNNVPKLKKQLGHNSIETTMIYTHVLNDTLKESVERADSAINYRNEDEYTE